MIDELAPASLKRLAGLGWLDFLEAICRLALQKAWPSKDVLERSEQDDALEYLIRLRVDDPKAHRQLMEERSVAWDAEPFLPKMVCVDNMVKGLIRVFELGSQNELGPQKAPDGKVTLKEARIFRTRKAPPKRVK